MENEKHSINKIYLTKNAGIEFQTLPHMFLSTFYETEDFTVTMQIKCFPSEEAKNLVLLNLFKMKRVY